MPDQRETLVRKMIEEGTSDDDIRATLSLFDKQAAPPRTWGDTALDVGKGVAKGAGRSVAGIVDMAAQSRMLPGLTPQSMPPEVVEKFTPEYANTPQRVGGAIETVAEFAAPAVRGGKALLSGAKALPSIVRGVKSGGPLMFDLATGNYPGAIRRLVKSGISSALESGAEDVATAAPKGRLVGAKAAKPIEEEMADAIAEVRRTTATPKITTPPELQLPAGFTPRTTATPKRAYFLKTDDVAPKSPAKGPVGLDDLPESWKAMTAPPSIAPRDIGGSELAGAYSQELIRRGIKPAAAMKAVRRNQDLPPEAKTQILAALMKVAKGA